MSGLVLLYCAGNFRLLPCQAEKVTACSSSNDNNLIVITLDFGTHTSNLVPKPGVSLDLADLVINPPAGLTLDFVTDLNNQGDMIGVL